MTRLDLLRRVPILRGLDATDLDLIAEAVREETFPAASKIVEIGEPGRSLYIITQGSVQILYPSRSTDVELARLGPGDFFGEMALLNGKPRSATARTLEPVTALLLDKEDFHRILMSAPAIGLKVLEVLSVRIRNADEQISGLSDKAMRDPLTGLLNRRAFHERLVEERDRANRYGENFSLLLLDLDNFKAVNDSFGHEAGDEILKWIGRLLIEHTRAADSPFRIGGEEFAVLAPATGRDVALSVAQRLVMVIAESKPPLTGDLHLTASAGYACCPEHGSRSEDLFNSADQALYRAKSEGRNRVGDPALPATADPT